MIRCDATMSTVLLYICVQYLGIMLIGCEAKNFELSYLIEHDLATHI